MCGILGLATSHHRALSLSAEVVSRLRDRMAHRGPDGAETIHRGHVALAHRRLAIIDPARGVQPIELFADDPQRHIVLVLNGEIYNHRELRSRHSLHSVEFRTQSDAETLAALLACEGAGAMASLRGMYALAAWFPGRHEFILARDPLGMKPLFWSFTHTEGGIELIFASEIPAILGHPEIRAEPDWVTLSAYLTTLRTTLGARTLFKGVQTIEPGEVRQFDLSTDALDARTWTIPAAAEVEFADLTFEEAAQRVRSVLDDSISSHLLSDRPIAALLSGGLDSSIIADAARRQIDGLTTWCIGAEDQNLDASSEPDDLAAARAAAACFGTDHHSFTMDEDLFHELWPWMIGRLGIPLSTPNETAIFAISYALSHHASVALSGEGADEMFGGYAAPLARAARYCAHPFTESGAPLPVERFHLNSGAWIAPAAKGTMLQGPVLRAIHRDADLFAHYRTAFEETGDSRDLGTHLEIQRRFNLTGLLSRLDGATMLASVEGRTPFADRHVLRCARSFPISYHVDEAALGAGEDTASGAVAVAAPPTATKLLLRAAYRHALPPAVLERPKASFPLPLAPWLPRGTDVLRRSALSREVFTEPLIGMILEDPSHRWRLAWPVINAAMWLERWWGQG